MDDPGELRSEPQRGGVRVVEDVLGSLEAAVMRRMWSRGVATVSAVHGDLADGRAGQIAYTTVMTVLDRLHDKGLVAREREGRRHIYRATLDEEGLVAFVGARAADAAIARYGAAALRQFAVRLDELDPATREQLLDLARRAGVEDPG